MKKTIIGVRRDDSFSPHAVENDRLILEAVLSRLQGDVRMVDERQLPSAGHADCFVTMGRLPETLALLQQMQAQGALVINTPESVAACERKSLDVRLRRLGLPLAPTEGAHGYWLKRGDAAAQSHDDVVFCPDRRSLAKAKVQFLRRGIRRWVAEAHVVGDVVKFYAVGDDFFRVFYPSDDGLTKFGDEQVNGRAHHYAFSVDRLHADVNRISHLTGVSVCGGDAVVDASGRYYIIDYNDWPSFFRCRDAAAEAIAGLINSKL